MVCLSIGVSVALSVCVMLVVLVVVEAVLAVIVVKEEAAIIAAAVVVMAGLSAANSGSFSLLCEDKS